MVDAIKIESVSGTMSITHRYNLVKELRKLGITTFYTETDSVTIVEPTEEQINILTEKLGEEYKVIFVDFKTGTRQHLELKVERL